MNIIGGKKIRDEILIDLKKELTLLSFKPVFCDVLVGEDSASVQYVNMKAKIAESIGISFHKANFPSSITTEELIKEIEALNKLPNMCGIIVQLPLPKNLDKNKILDTINPFLDVDCLGKIASEKFYRGEIKFGFPAALACIKLLDSLNLSLENKSIVVLGQGELVGKPVSVLLELRGLKPVKVDSETKNKEDIIKNADIIISGIGNGKYITGPMIKKGVVIIDAGTSESNNSIVGDVDTESVKDMASYLSPVPGGVGPVTIAMLFSNVVNVAKSLNKNII